jgi:hypothetical protein
MQFQSFLKVLSLLRRAGKDWLFEDLYLSNQIDHGVLLVVQLFLKERIVEGLVSNILDHFAFVNLSLSPLFIYLLTSLEFRVDVLDVCVVQFIRAILDLTCHHCRSHFAFINLRLLQSGHQLVISLPIIIIMIISPHTWHREYLHLHILLTNILNLSFQIRNLLLDLPIFITFILHLHFFNASL